MAGDSTVIYTDSEFGEQTSGKIALVDFWATWCGPCRQQGPIIDELAEELKDTNFVVGKLDVDSNTAVATKFNVMNIPTLLILKDGEEVKRFVGTQQASVLKDALEEI
ncbi:MAG: thioredoxin [Planctomycetota bacterium]|nr:MAG: thioredoxin [Planctomycetota bacterium]